MTEQLPEFYCQDLPTRPCPEQGRVLVTGATGYIGGRLIPELVARGYEVRAMVRDDSPDLADRWPGVEIIVADANKEEDLTKALDGIHTAYYLIHSLLLGPRDFHDRDMDHARKFRDIAESKEVKRIIYLGGLGDLRTELSLHLRSRADVARELGKGKVPLTTLRAAIIMGSGSASYEIIRHLINLPAIGVPWWGRTKCQPIAIRDVIRYLVGVLESPDTEGVSLDIGGADILTYENMLKVLAEVFGRRVIFFSSPFANMRVYSFLAAMMTPVPSAIVVSLMESLMNDVLCEDDRITKLIPFARLTYREAIVNAMTREEQDSVHTRWSDAYPPAHELAMKLHETDPPPKFTSSYALLTDKPAADLFRAFCRVGGKKGWFDGNWMWRIRGFVDRLMSGVGTHRGRRSVSSLRINDVIDFWRVENIVQNRFLLLRAEMIMPGRAWLEFHIRHVGTRQRLCITAYFQPRGFWGHIYWYMFLPFHFYIFNDLLAKIEETA